MRPMLETRDLVNALEEFGERYHAVDVFADSLSESAKEDVRRGITRVDGSEYSFTVFPKHGVVRLTRGVPDGSATVVGMAAGAALGAAIAAASNQRGEGVFVGALLGLLVGGMLGAAVEPEIRVPRRVFAMELNPGSREWVAYDGSLLRWMKERLLPLDEAGSVEPKALTENASQTGSRKTTTATSAATTSRSDAGSTADGTSKKPSPPNRRGRSMRSR